MNMDKLELKTKRLVVRPYRASDYEAWRDGFLTRQKKRNEFDLDTVSPVQVSRTIFRKMLRFHEKGRRIDRLYVFGVFERKSGKCVGFLDVSVQERLVFQYANLGYVIHNQFWGRGYASEAATAVARLAFRELKLHRIEIGTDARNKASAGVAKSIGAKFESKRRRYVYENGGWQDLRYYILLPEDIGLRSGKPVIKTTMAEILGRA